MSVTPNHLIVLLTFFVQGFPKTTLRKFGWSEETIDKHIEWMLRCGYIDEAWNFTLKGCEVIDALKTVPSDQPTFLGELTRIQSGMVFDAAKPRLQNYLDTLAPPQLEGLQNHLLCYTQLVEDTLHPPLPQAPDNEGWVLTADPEPRIQIHPDSSPFITDFDAVRYVVWRAATGSEFHDQVVELIRTNGADSSQAIILALKVEKPTSVEFSPCMQCNGGDICKTSPGNAEFWTVYVRDEEDLANAVLDVSDKHLAQSACAYIANNLDIPSSGLVL